ncbi:hypothetical protein GF407_04320 [candidate division KSB1 bacterium]|nr:hypothetical protein [candidate division KSB1 bacterium]
MQSQTGLCYYNTRGGKIHAGIDDEKILEYLQHYFKGDNRLTELSPAYQLIPGTGFFMPPCTLHAPGSLVTYELQVASDVTRIPESRVNDLVMPSDLLDRDIPVSVQFDGVDSVSEYILSMIRCSNGGNSDDFHHQLLFYQHFGSDSNPEACSLESPPFNRFSNELHGELGY